MRIVQFVNNIIRRLPDDLEIKKIDTNLYTETSKIFFRENESRLVEMTCYENENDFECSFVHGNGDIKTTIVSEHSINTVIQNFKEYNNENECDPTFHPPPAR